MRSVEHPLRSLAMAIVMGCFAACVEAKQFLPIPPEVPKLRQPMNGSYHGSTFAGELRPRFQWDSDESDGQPEGRFFELQYSNDYSFNSGTVSVQTRELSFQSDTSLNVALTPPVGARYYWRVRTCLPEVCSEYSSVWHVNLGRSRYDLNGDGYSDVAVGAPDDSSSGSATGKVYIYFGGPGATFDSSPDGEITGGAAGSQFGKSLSSGGDFNGDGFADLLVGAPRDASSGALAGKLYLYLGGPGALFDTDNDGEVPGFFPGDQMGAALSLHGDLNGDGFSDAVIGAPSADSVGVDSGRAYVYLGREDSVLSNPLLIDGERAGERFSKRVEIVSDLNGDGFAELVVDDGPIFTEIGLNDCNSRVFVGGAGVPLGGLQRKKISSDAEAPCSLLASSAGDLNGDGYGDLLVAYSLAQARIGFLLGKYDLDVMAKVATVSSGRLLMLSSSGDINGDGVDDVVASGGGIKIYLGRKGESTFSLPAPFGSIADQQADSMSVVDLNGDQFDDLIVGDSSDDASGLNAGRVHIYFGNSDIWDSTPDGVLDPAVPNAQFGSDLM